MFLQAMKIIEKNISIGNLQALYFRNFPEYTEEVLNNLLSLSDNHLYIAIPTFNSWRASGHPQVFDGKEHVWDVEMLKELYSRIQNIQQTTTDVRARCVQKKTK